MEWQIKQCEIESEKNQHAKAWVLPWVLSSGGGKTEQLLILIDFSCGNVCRHLLLFLGQCANMWGEVDMFYNCKAVIHVVKLFLK